MQEHVYQAVGRLHFQDVGSVNPYTVFKIANKQLLQDGEAQRGLATWKNPRWFDNRLKVNLLGLHSSTIAHAFPKLDTSNLLAVYPKSL